jgi:hypothetical protein
MPIRLHEYGILDHAFERALARVHRGDVRALLVLVRDTGVDPNRVVRLDPDELILDKVTGRLLLRERRRLEEYPLTQRVQRALEGLPEHDGLVFRQHIVWSATTSLRRACGTGPRVTLSTLRRLYVREDLELRLLARTPDHELPLVINEVQTVGAQAVYRSRFGA